MPSYTLDLSLKSLDQWRPLFEAALHGNDDPTASASVLVVPVLQKEDDDNGSCATGCGGGDDASGEDTKKLPVEKLQACDLMKDLSELVFGTPYTGPHCCHFAPLLNEDGFDASSGKLFLWKNVVNGHPVRVLFVGLGPGSKLTPAKLDKALTKGLTQVKDIKGVKSLAVVLPSQSALAPETSLEIGVDALYQATYRSAEGIAKAQDQKAPVPTLTHVHLLMGTVPGECAFTKARSLAEARSHAKDLVNMPPNLKSTQTLADLATSLAEIPGVSVTVYDDPAWIEKEMPAFFQVARGSLASDPPKFICARYVSPTLTDGVSERKKITLVGKGVIFDTGGYQVKPGNSMNTMKGDMTGGAMVLVALKALAECGVPNLELNVYCAATPNKIDSDAMVPDTIVRATCGKYIEIRHTDAEGRLTLIDAVTKAAEESKPEVLLTVATLTGAAMAALGRRIAIMANNADWRAKVTAAADKVGDPYDTLEVFEDDYEAIRCKLDGADIVNSIYGRFRGAQTAAAFVMTGAPKKLPVVHLDIAGADMTDDDKATGIGQKTLIQFVLDELQTVGTSCSG